MENRKDILKDSRIKENAFTVPEGYFEGLQSQLEARRGMVGKTSLTGRLVPYLAIAASFAVIVLAGTAVLRKTVTPASEEISFESYYAQLVDEEISEDEIVSYLLCSGISAEDISEFSK